MSLKKTYKVEQFDFTKKIDEIKILITNMNQKLLIYPIQ